ncbi:MAG: hypothetical protein ACQET5_07685 [Halobacteriota archaeon]
MLGFLWGSDDTTELLAALDGSGPLDRYELEAHLDEHRNAPIPSEAY